MQQLRGVVFSLDLDGLVSSNRVQAAAAFELARKKHVENERP